jgi:hypothetical protein
MYAACTKQHSHNGYSQPLRLTSSSTHQPTYTRWQKHTAYDTHCIKAAMAPAAWKQQPKHAHPTSDGGSTTQAAQHATSTTLLPQLSSRPRAQGRPSCLY